jgi:hypothetical protein
MDWGILLTAVKFVGIALSASFGVAAIRVEGEDDPLAKRHKRRIALYGLLAGALISFTTEGLEARRARAEQLKAATEQKESAAQTARLLTSIERTLNPIQGDLSLTYWLELPLDSPGFAAYKRRLEPAIQEFLRDPNGPARGDFFVAVSNHDKPEELGISPGSQLLPSRDEVVPYFVVNNPGLYLDFFRNPLSPDEYKVSANTKTDPAQAKQPDFSISTPLDPPQSGSLRLEYDLVNRKLLLMVSEVTVPRTSWHQNARFASVLDFRGAAMFARCHDIMQTGDPNIDPRIHQARRQINLDGLILRTTGRELIIKKGGFRRAEDQRGPFFYYSIPANFGENLY